MRAASVGYPVVSKIEQGHRLKEARDALGLSMSGLGELVGVNRTTIDSWEKGKTAIPSDKLELLSVVTGFTGSYLLSGEGPRERKSAAPLADRIREAREAVTEELIRTLETAAKGGRKAS